MNSDKEPMAKAAVATEGTEPMILTEATAPPSDGELTRLQNEADGSAVGFVHGLLQGRGIDLVMALVSDFVVSTMEPVPSGLMKKSMVWTSGGRSLLELSVPMWELLRTENPAAGISFYMDLPQIVDLDYDRGRKREDIVNSCKFCIWFVHRVNEFFDRDVEKICREFLILEDALRSFITTHHTCSFDTMFVFFEAFDELIREQTSQHERGENGDGGDGGDGYQPDDQPRPPGPTHGSGGGPTEMDIFAFDELGGGYGGPFDAEMDIFAFDELSGEYGGPFEAASGTPKSESTDHADNEDEGDSCDGNGEHLNTDDAAKSQVAVLKNAIAAAVQGPKSAIDRTSSEETKLIKRVIRKFFTKNPRTSPIQLKYFRGKVDVL